MTEERFNQGDTVVDLIFMEQFVYDEERDKYVVRTFPKRFVSLLDLKDTLAAMEGIEPIFEEMERPHHFGPRKYLVRFPATEVIVEGAWDEGEAEFLASNKLDAESVEAIL